MVSSVSQTYNINDIAVTMHSTNLGTRQTVFMKSDDFHKINEYILVKLKYVLVVMKTRRISWTRNIKVVSSLSNKFENNLKIIDARSQYLFLYLE